MFNSTTKETAVTTHTNPFLSKEFLGAQILLFKRFRKLSPLRKSLSVSQLQQLMLTTLD